MNMDQVSWILWLVLGIALMVAEIFTFGFFLFFFGLGALAAALVGFLGAGFGLQFLTFFGVSIVLTVMSRTLFARYFAMGTSEAIRSNVDSLPGQIGTVTSGSGGALRESAVRVYGSVWTAYPVEGESDLVEGEKVEVVEVRGSSIIVRKAGRQLPDWRQE
jgi:membrane protein implicated in regulation of membrane protease activity